MTATIQNRLSRLREKMSSLEMDGFLVTQPHNRRYLSGYTAPDGPVGESAGWLLISPQKVYLLTNPLTYELARQQAEGMEVVRTERSPMPNVVEGITSAGIRRVGFEETHLTYAQYRELKDSSSGCELVACRGVIEELRAVKDEEEVAAIHRAIEVADRAIEELLEKIKPGMTEKEAAWLLEAFMRQAGAEGVSFELLVASGPNSAIPHAVPTDRPISIGEPVWADIGCIVDGYCSDLTRSFCLGQPDQRLVEVYSTVRQAQEIAEEAMRAGMKGQEVDKLAREVIEKAGYGSAFTHSLGHGVGLAVHELPRLSPVSEDVTKQMMVATVEPGIYLPGWGGIRIEDMVIFRDSGVQVLTGAGKDSLLGI